MDLAKQRSYTSCACINRCIVGGIKEDIKSIGVEMWPSLMEVKRVQLFIDHSKTIN